MRIKIEMYVNPKRFKEYAIKYKEGIFGKWKYVKTIKGDNAIFSKAEMEAVVEMLHNQFD